MADLLLEEARYDQAIDYIFAVSFLGTSGMKDHNEVIPIETVSTKKGQELKYFDNGLPYIALLEIYNYQVVSPFLKANDVLNYDWNEIRKRFIESKLVNSIEKILPFTYFAKEEAFEFFREAVEDGGSKGFFSIKDLKKNLKFNMPDAYSSAYFYMSADSIFYRAFRKE